MTGLEITRGSGCGLIEKGDLGSGSCIHLEAKSTRTDKIAIQKAWIDKIRKQAREYGKKVWFLQVAFTRRFETEINFPELRWLLVTPELWSRYWVPAIEDLDTFHSSTENFVLRQSRGQCDAAVIEVGGKPYVLFPEKYLDAELVTIIEEEFEDEEEII